MYPDRIEKILSYPQRRQIQIDFDDQRTFLEFSVPIFSSIEEIPQHIKDYVAARRDLSFGPHRTSYHLRGHQIWLIQKIPFALGVRSTFRMQADEFWKMAVECHKMLAEMAAEEMALNLRHFPSDI